MTSHGRFREGLTPSVPHDCADDDSEPNNLEVHPVYSIDVVEDSHLPRPDAALTGAWAATDVGTYYVRLVGNTVWWLGLSRDRGLTFASVFQGTIHSSVPGDWTIAGDSADISLGAVLSGGTMSLGRGPSASRQSPSTLTRLSVTGGFGADKWQKLYEPHSGLVGPSTGTVETQPKCQAERTTLANLQSAPKENLDEMRRLRSSYRKAPAQQKQIIQLEIKEAQATERDLLQQIGKAEQLLRECVRRPE